MRRFILFGTLLLALIALVVSTQVTVFVIQPLGALPEGRTLILRRTGRLKFVDSPDAVCQREIGGVSLLCRATVLAAVVRADTRLLSLPYSDTLYLASTGGKRFDR